MPGWYKLVGRTTVPCLVKECKSVTIKNSKLRIMDDIVQVSTVFLGLDHNYLGSGPPILFETMVFGGNYDQFQARYPSIEEAEQGHQEVIKMVQGLKNNL